MKYEHVWFNGFSRSKRYTKILLYIVYFKKTIFVKKIRLSRTLITNYVKRF